MCPFFTVDTAKDLKDPKKVNMGIMLMPATVMLSQLKGLPSLEYLQEQLAGL